MTRQSRSSIDASASPTRTEAPSGHPSGPAALARPAKLCPARRAKVAGPEPVETFRNTVLLHHRLPLPAVQLWLHAASDPAGRGRRPADRRDRPDAQPADDELHRRARAGSGRRWPCCLWHLVDLRGRQGAVRLSRSMAPGRCAMRRTSSNRCSFWPASSSPATPRTSSASSLAAQVPARSASSTASFDPCARDLICYRRRSCRAPATRADLRQHGHHALHDDHGGDLSPDLPWQPLLANVGAAAMIGYTVAMLQARTLYLILFARCSGSCCSTGDRRRQSRFLGLSPRFGLALIALIGLEVQGRLGASFGFNFLVPISLPSSASASSDFEGVTSAAEGVDQRIGWWTKIYERMMEIPSTCCSASATACRSPTSTAAVAPSSASRTTRTSR